MVSGRALYISSIYVYEKPEEAYGIILYTDKQVYSIGEDVTISINVTKSGDLTITAPNFNASITIEEPKSLDLQFSLPELRSGTYYIDYTFGNFSSSYPIDVVGYYVRIIECALDKQTYESGDTITLRINVDTNRNFNGTLKIWGYDSLGNLIMEYETNRTFTLGENKITLTRALLTNVSGIHSIVYGIYADLPHFSPVLLASGARYFDVADTFPPTAPTNVRWITPQEDNTPSFEWESSQDDTGIAGYYVKIDLGDDIWVGNVLSYTCITPLADGDHTFYVKAMDVAGYHSAYSSIAFKIVTVPLVIAPSVIAPPPDTVPPKVTVTAPSNASYLKGMTLLNVSAIDIQTGIDRVEFYVNASLVYVDEEPPYTSSWNTTSYADGTYTIEAVAFDRAGNSKSKRVLVTVDNTLPSINIETPADGSYLKGVVSISIAGSDANFDWMELRIDDKPVKTWDISGDQTSSWDTATYADGQYLIKLVVVDKAGNIAESSITVISDNTPPILEIISPTEGVDFDITTITVSWRGLDDVSGIHHYEVQLEEGPWINVGESISYTLKELTKTSHRVSIKAVDRSGNVAKSITSFTVGKRAATSILNQAKNEIESAKAADFKSSYARSLLEEAIIKYNAAIQAFEEEDFESVETHAVNALNYISQSREAETSFEMKQKALRFKMWIIAIMILVVIGLTISILWRRKLFAHRGR